MLAVAIRHGDGNLHAEVRRIFAPPSASGGAGRVHRLLLHSPESELAGYASSDGKKSDTGGVRRKSRLARAAAFVRRAGPSSAHRVPGGAAVPAPMSPSADAPPARRPSRLRRVFGAGRGAFVALASAVASGVSELAEPLLDGSAAEGAAGAMEGINLDELMEYQRAKAATIQRQAAAAQAGGSAAMFQKLVPLAVLVYIFFISKPVDDQPKGKGVPRGKKNGRKP
eukprot:CAMPEP_0194293842 /NCGR_PEP_ID=MMETSP0169-20130528/48793_1 /TAXON_ID=218684 /ORGANISM="Corethron pennatum, Strain L29A3" /LENGTH=225 /DNA_ID=CAMNT_0039042503 /DNA_START=107 /DNA_END=785 /DNA_ORIENTATION=-